MAIEASWMVLQTSLQVMLTPNRSCHNLLRFFSYLIPHLARIRFGMMIALPSPVLRSLYSVLSQITQSGSARVGAFRFFVTRSTNQSRSQVSDRPA